MDFGCAKVINATVSGGRGGTAFYMDPERIMVGQASVYFPVSTKAGDIYSFGITCFQVSDLLAFSLFRAALLIQASQTLRRNKIWTGLFPYGQEPETRHEEHELLQKIVFEHKRPDLQVVGDMPYELKHLLQKCWARARDDRPESFSVVAQKLHRLLYVGFRIFLVS